MEKLLTRKKIRTYSNNLGLVHERRKHIVLCSSTLFAKKGYDQTTTEEIAEACGMSKGGLYHYVGSKEDVLHMIIDFTLSETRSGLREFEKRLEKLTPTEALVEVVKTHIKSIEGVQDMYNFINHVLMEMPRRDREVIFEAQNQIVAYLEVILKNGIEAGEFKIDNPLLVAHNILLICDAWAHRRWFLRKHYTLDEYIESQMKFILNAVCDNNRAVLVHD